MRGRRSVAVAAVLVAAALGYGVVPQGVADGDRRGDSELERTGVQLGGVERAEATTNATVIIGPNGHLTGFENPNVTMSEGATVRVINREGLSHTFTSVAVDSDGDPLFDVTIPPNSTRWVPAARLLKPGRYGFVCTIHPNMRGVLTVEGEPTPGGQTGLSFDEPLRIPPLRTADHITLTARRTLERVLPDGPRTPMWTYDGSFPGPTIMRPAGRRTRVTIVNELPRVGEQLSLHFHGDHHAARHDGQPDTFLVPQDGRRTYNFPLTEEGKPERAAFEWYHDHRMDRTGRNVWRGLLGMFIVTSRHERQLRLPAGEYDVPLVVTDRSFNDDNTLAGTFRIGMVRTGPDAPPNDATVGSRILVNGTLGPHLKVAARRYRLRILNGSNFSAYNVAFSDGRPFVQIGTGNGLLRHPVKRRSILLGPAQRVDVVVDFHGDLGKRLVLKSVPRTDRTLSGQGARQAQLMQFRVVRRAADASRVPYDLGRIPRIAVPAAVDKTFVFDLGGDPATGTFWTVNGRMFDPDRVDHYVRLGSTERWLLRNDAPITHFIHLHQERWHTILRNGHRPPPWEQLGLEDTWRLDPGESVVVAAKFTDYTGKFMIHCHMLDHEDHGLMAQFGVVKGTTARFEGKSVAFDVPGTSTHTHTHAHDASHAHAATPAIDQGGRSIAGVRFSGARAGQALAVELAAAAGFLVVRRRLRLLVD